MNTWLQTHARRNQQLGTSRTNVITNDQGKIVAYVSLTAAEIKRDYLAKSQQRNRPDSILAVLLGQLAVDSNYQGQGIAQSLLFFAFHTTVKISEQIGCACLITHPLDEKARGFYNHWGFEDTPFDPKGSMIIRVSDLNQNGF